MFPFLARVYHAFFKDELAFRRWMRGGLFFLFTIAGQLVLDPKWETWTFREWMVHTIPAVIAFAGGAMQSSAKKPDLPPESQPRGFFGPGAFRWALFFTALLLAVGVCIGRKAFGAVIQRSPFGFAALCVDGIAMRADGSLGSGAKCIVRDQNGTVLFVDSISVYDNALGGP